MFSDSRLSGAGLHIADFHIADLRAEADRAAERRSVRTAPSLGQRLRRGRTSR